jgi:REP element-mobilizing transposase RayT
LWLSSVFAIGICAYAVMSNHVHLVLCVDKDKAMSWSDKQVVGRWHRLHRGTLLSQKFMRNVLLSESEWISLKETIAIYRKRLYDISWLMASLSEPIARQANKEDGCTGRFWEGRFKSQALLDDAAVLSCMAYVDLNPIRAKMAKPLKPHSTPAFKNEPRPYNSYNANLISYSPLSATPDKTCLKVLPFRYKITVNWLTPQAALSEQTKQVLSTQHTAPF